MDQGWRSGEVTCLLPIWLGIDSRTRRHMWVEFVVSSRVCFDTSKFQFDLDSVPVSALR